MNMRSTSRGAQFKRNDAEQCYFPNETINPSVSPGPSTVKSTKATPTPTRINFATPNESSTTLKASSKQSTLKESSKQSTLKASSKQSTLKASSKQSTLKESFKESTLKESSLKEPTLKQSTIKESTIKESTIKESTQISSNYESKKFPPVSKPRKHPPPPKCDPKPYVIHKDINFMDDPGRIDCFPPSAWDIMNGIRPIVYECLNRGQPMKQTPTDGHIVCTGPLRPVRATPCLRLRKRKRKIKKKKKIPSLSLQPSSNPTLEPPKPSSKLNTQPSTPLTSPKPSLRSQNSSLPAPKPSEPNSKPSESNLKSSVPSPKPSLQSQKSSIPAPKSSLPTSKPSEPNSKPSESNLKSSVPSPKPSLQSQKSLLPSPKSSIPSSKLSQLDSPSSQTTPESSSSKPLFPLAVEPIPTPLSSVRSSITEEGSTAQPSKQQSGVLDLYKASNKSESLSTVEIEKSPIPSSPSSIGLKPSPSSESTAGTLSRKSTMKKSSTSASNSKPESVVGISELHRNHSSRHTHHNGKEHSTRNLQNVQDCSTQCSPKKKRKCAQKKPKKPAVFPYGRCQPLPEACELIWVARNQSSHGRRKLRFAVSETQLLFDMPYTKPQTSRHKMKKLGRSDRSKDSLIKSKSSQQQMHKTKIIYPPEQNRSGCDTTALKKKKK